MRCLQWEPNFIAGRNRRHTAPRLFSFIDKVGVDQKLVDSGDIRNPLDYNEEFKDMITEQLNEMMTKRIIHF